LRLYLYAGGDEWSPYVSLACRADSLAVGALIAAMLRLPPIWSWCVERRRLIAVFTIGLLLSGVPILSFQLAGDISKTMFYWGHTFLNLLFGLVLSSVLLHRGGRQLRLLRSGPLRWIAAISYAAYLTHVGVLMLVFAAVGRQPALSDLQSAGLIIIAFVVTGVLCRVSYEFLESRCITLGHAVRFGPPEQRIGDERHATNSVL
jgi:peptidoglycan/LPS O-acetylase OafA/YrhL